MAGRIRPRRRRRAGLCRSAEGCSWKEVHATIDPKLDLGGATARPIVRAPKQAVLTH
jgi:hypothetical protein